MKLESADLSSLFSNTLLPDIFFSEYLSEASGDFIKVYLYMVFLSKYDKDIKVNDLSKKLVLPLKTIQDAVKYWEDKCLITKKNTGYIINSIQEIELHKLYKPKTALSADQLKKSAENQKRAKAIDFINNKYFSGLMPTTWYPEIELWFKKYNFDEEVMIALFGYCFDKSALHKNYVQTVAEAWNKNNIRSFNDLDTYYEKQEKINVIAKTISKKLGISRNLTQYEYGYISLPEATQEAVLSLIKFWACIVTTRIVMNALSHRYYKMTCNAQQMHLFTGYTFTIALLAALVSNLLPCPFTFIEFAPMYMIWVIYKGKDYLNVEEEDTLNFVVTTSALLLGLPFVWNSILHMIVD